MLFKKALDESTGLILAFTGRAWDGAIFMELLVRRYSTDRDLETHSIPGRDSFVRDWLPICRHLHLEWVPLFQLGLPLGEADIPFVIQELELMKCFLRQSLRTQGQRILQIEALIIALREAQTPEGVDVLIR